MAAPLEPMTIDIDELRGTFGLGVAGNFAGHLEQAGESVDFAHVSAAASMPKGIFPWYVPGAESFLGAFPCSSDTLVVPSGIEQEHQIQIEPELGLYCTVQRDADGAVRSLQPQWVAAFDDCSIRRSGARKISEKKNWGTASTGVSAVVFAVDSIEPDGPLAQMRLGCWLLRDGQLHRYGVDSPVGSYMLFGSRLLEWIVDRLREQRGDEGTPLEDVGALVDDSGAAQVLIGVGATRYEPFGDVTSVEPGDEAVVVLYDAATHAPADVESAIAARRDDTLRMASVLRRVAVAQD